MLAHRVVEPLDVVEHVRAGLFPGPVDLAAGSLRLQGREEALHGRVVPALPAPAHAAGDALGLEQLLELVTGVLAALVRVVHQGAGFAAPPQGHEQGVADHLGLHGVAHGPTHDTPRVQVHDRCGIQQAFCRPDVGEVRCPLLVRPIGLEVPLQVVRGNVVLQPVHVVRGQPTPLTPGLQLGLAHQPGNPVKSAALAHGAQIVPDTWAAVGAVTELEALTDEPGQPGVVLAALAGSSAQPFVEPAVGHRHDPAHHAGGPDATVPGNEGVLHCGSLAK